MKSKAGGGIASNKFNNNVAVRGGSPRAEVVSPTSARQVGQSLAYKRDPLPIGTKQAPVLLGNAVALNVGSGGPGTGRTIHPCGSQHNK